MMMLRFVDVLLWTVCGAQINRITQPVSLMFVNLGDPVTLECLIESDLQRGVWYKLTAEKRLQNVATFNSKYNYSTMEKEYEQRYSVSFNRVSSSLDISAVTLEDAGRFFCGLLTSHEVHFGSGTSLMFEGNEGKWAHVYRSPGFVVLCTILGVSVAGLVCVIIKRFLFPSKATAESPPDMDYIKDVAVKKTRIRTSKGQRDHTWSECVYFRESSETEHYLFQPYY